MKITIPATQAIKTDLADIGRSGPFAASIGLNKLGDRVQAKIRGHVSNGRDFTLRRSRFVLNTIKRERGPEGDFATRNRLQAGVRIDPNPKRDFLAKHVDGGVKRPQSASRSVVTRVVDRVRGRSTGPSSLLIPVAIRGAGAGGVVTAAQRARLRVDPRVARIKTDDGKEFLVRFSGRGRSARTEVLFRLVKSVPLRPRLPIYDIARNVCEEWWLESMRSGIMEAMLRNIGRRR